MDSKTISEIVKILTEDEHLVKKWVELHQELDLPDFIYLKEKRNAGNLNTYELFRDIIVNLKSKEGSQRTLKVLCQTLNNMSCSDTSHKIKAAFKIDEAAESNQPIFFGFNPISKNFTGRYKQMDKIENMMEGRTDDFVKIIGMGGIGKTELAKKFAYRHKEWNWIWLNADTSQILLTCVARFAESIEITNGSPKIKDLFRSCLEAIKKKNAFKIMVIFDNVDADYTEAQALIDVIKNEPNCSAIVTSRHVGVMGYAGDATINLQTLDDEEAIQLIRSYLEGECDQDILSLCLRLDNFPLALQQAAAFIKRKQIVGVLEKLFKIPQYLDLYNKETLKLLNFPLIELEHEYRKTTFITWNTSIKAIQADEDAGTNAIELLKIMAYMKADEIPVPLIKDIYYQFERSNDQIMEAAIELLIAYSLVTVQSGLISVHRLVQEVIRVQLRRLVDNKILIKLIKAIDKLNIIGSSNFRQLKHSLSVWRYFSQLQADDLEKKFMSERINLMNILFLGRYSDQDFYSESVKLVTQILGEQDKQRLVIESRAATFYPCSNYNEENLQKLKLVYQKQTEIGEDKESLVTAYSLSYTLVNCEKIDEALELMQTIRNRHHNWDQLLFNVIERLTYSLKIRAITVEAVEMGEHVLRYIINQEGDQHPWAILTRKHIRFDDNDFKYIPIEKYERLLQVFVRVFGQDSENVISLKRRIRENPR